MPPEIKSVSDKDFEKLLLAPAVFVNQCMITHNGATCRLTFFEVLGATGATRVAVSLPTEVLISLGQVVATMMGAEGPEGAGATVVGRPN